MTKKSIRHEFLVSLTSENLVEVGTFLKERVHEIVIFDHNHYSPMTTRMQWSLHYRTEKPGKDHIAFVGMYIDRDEDAALFKMFFGDYLVPVMTWDQVEAAVQRQAARNAEECKASWDEEIEKIKKHRRRRKQ